MQFTLKDYQSDAVFEVLRKLRFARQDVHERGETVSFSLSASTGAGKTVMASAVIEALFEGSDEFDFLRDETAVVLWVTDSPDLNRQTKFRLLESGDRVHESRLIEIEHPFPAEKLTANNVYFLNVQKLYKSSLLVKDFVPEQGTLPSLSGSDLRGISFWETLANTIADENLTLYLVLDEAHKGMKSSKSRDGDDNRSTVIKRLINGQPDLGVPPVPVVWGISATVDRFSQAMKDAESEGRSTYSPVTIDPALVQASGLLKDNIALDFPNEVGAFDSVLLARAVKEIRKASDAWAEYSLTSSDAGEVLPLLVLQVPNTPTDKMLTDALRVIYDGWPGLGPDAVAHVFGERATLSIAGREVPYIEPARVQESTYVRILLAKDAVNEGWDCPRAEVLVSFRPAKDKTHITQLLGRMVRTPLARSIPGNDQLNTVTCLLPFFDQKAARSVASILRGTSDTDENSGGTGGGAGRKVMLAPITVEWNPLVPREVGDFMSTLPSQTLPRQNTKPIKRLTALAQALSMDEILHNAGSKAHAHLYSVLDGQSAQFKAETEAAFERLLTVRIRRIDASLKLGLDTIVDLTEASDDRVIDDAFRAAGRVLSPDVARGYADYLADREKDDDGEVDLQLARAQVAALASVSYVKDNLEREADQLVKKWFGDFRVDIKGLSAERQAMYDGIKAQSRDPQSIDLLAPINRVEETISADESSFATRDRHLLSDVDGQFPIGSLGSSWEEDVLDQELLRPDLVAWYRNPSRASSDAISVAYQLGKGWKQMQPDFLFFSRGSEGTLRASIVDPHGFHLSDAHPKLLGLAAFAEEFGDQFHRIDAVAQTKSGQLRVLDLKDGSVREEVKRLENVELLYEGTWAQNY